MEFPVKIDRMRPLTIQKSRAIIDSILKKGLEKDAVREELQRDAAMG